MFAFEKYHDLDNRIIGHSKSLEMTPYRLHMTSYSLWS